MQQESRRNQNIGDFNRFIEKQLKKGTPKTQVLSQVINDGLDESTAKELIDHVYSQVCREFIQGSTKDLTWGFVVLMVGAGATYWSFTSAYSDSKYYIMWGAIAYGLFRLSEGFAKKIKYSSNSSVRRLWMFGGISAACVVFAAGALFTIITMIEW